MMPQSLYTWKLRICSICLVLSDLHNHSICSFANILQAGISRTHGEHLPTNIFCIWFWRGIWRVLFISGSGIGRSWKKKEEIKKVKCMKGNSGKCFTYVAKTIANSTTYSRKPGGLQWHHYFWVWHHEKLVPTQFEINLPLALSRSWRAQNKRYLAGVTFH